MITSQSLLWHIKEDHSWIGSLLRCVLVKFVHQVCDEMNNIFTLLLKLFLEMHEETSGEKGVSKYVEIVSQFFTIQEASGWKLIWEIYPVRFPD